MSVIENQICLERLEAWEKRGGAQKLPLGKQAQG